MKNKGLLIGLILLQCILLLLSLTSCVRLKPDPKKMEKKMSIPGAEWATKNRDVVFYVGEDGIGYISKAEEQKVDVYVEFTFGSDIRIYPLEVYNARKENGTESPLYTIEIWYGKYKSFNEFSVKVIESTYFTVGEKMVFYRVGEVESDKETQ